MEWSVRWAIAFSVVLIASVPFSRHLTDWLRARLMLRPTILLLCVIGFCVLAWFGRQQLKLFSWRHWLGLSVILCLYGAGMGYFVVAPEEQMHFLQLTVLAFLFQRAFQKRNEPPQAQAWKTFLSTALVGV